MKIVSLFQSLGLRFTIFVIDLFNHGKKCFDPSLQLCSDYIAAQPEERIKALNMLDLLAKYPPSTEGWVEYFNFILKTSNTIGLEYPDTAKQPFKLFTLLELRNDKIKQDWRNVQDIRYEYLAQ